MRKDVNEIQGVKDVDFSDPVLMQYKHKGFPDLVDKYIVAVSIKIFLLIIRIPS